jgi:uncharacterized protein (TIGR03792 family)
MIIEWLKFEVDAKHRELLIEKDELVWTKALAKYPGFLGKDIWIDARQPNTVVFVIHWANRDAWKTIPASELEQADQEFARQMGTVHYQLKETGEYQVRRFARTPNPEGDC